MQKKIEDIYKYIRLKKFEQAERLVLSKLEEDSENGEYNFIFGLILAQKRDFTKALKYFQKTADGKDATYDSYFNCGNCLQMLMRFEEAVEYYHRCIYVDPERHEPYLQIGVCYKRDKEFEKSITYLRKANELQENVEHYQVLGNVLREMGEFNEAKKQFEKCLILEEENKIAQLSLINIEIDEGKLNSARKKVLIFLENKKNDQKYIDLAKLQLGHICQSSGDYEGAIEINKEILNVNANNYDAAYNLSICYLFMKNFEEAWTYYEKRFYSNSFALLKQNYYKIKKPRWDLSRPKKDLLIWGEQGLGDQILYSQFIEFIKDDFNNLTLALNKKLIPFFKKIYPNLNFIDYKKINKFDDYEFHLPIGSLGLFFQKYIKKENLQKKRDYNIISDIPKKIKNIRCGISWKSTNKLTNHKKSIELKKLDKILNIEEIEFINLQYTNEEIEISDVESKLNKKFFVDHNVDCFDDIDGVASLISTCDFIISVSNSNVHIAGKLGKKVLLLLPFNDGKLWYWGLNEDEEIIWYPSVCPIRQKKENDWDSCIKLLEKEIENFL